MWSQGSSRILTYWRKSQGRQSRWGYSSGMLKPNWWKGRRSWSTNNAFDRTWLGYYGGTDGITAGVTGGKRWTICPWEIVILSSSLSILYNDFILLIKISLVWRKWNSSLDSSTLLSRLSMVTFCVFTCSSLLTLQCNFSGT